MVAPRVVVCETGAFDVRGAAPKAALICMRRRVVVGNTVRHASRPVNRGYRAWRIGWIIIGGRTRCLRKEKPRPACQRDHARHLVQKGPATNSRMVFHILSLSVVDLKRPGHT